MKLRDVCCLIVLGCAGVDMSWGEGRFAVIEDFMKPDGRMRVIAHRGFSGEAPENTMAAFRKAIEIGADMIELDVLLSRDGQVVVIHDATLDRTTNGTGNVAEHSLAELADLDGGTWFSPAYKNQRIPTLKEVLDLARGKILVNVEIKTEAVTDELGGGITEKVVELVRTHDMRDQVVVSSFDPRALEQMRRLDPGITTAALFNRDLHEGKSPREVMDEVGSRGFNVSHERVDAAVTRICHEMGRPVAVYTVNEVEKMEELLELGVDALFTDFPDRLLELLRARRSDK